MRIHNFNPGPAILPDVVKTEAAKSIVDYNDRGVSILEMSHRSPDIMNIFEEASALVYDILGISKNDFEVVWLSGGASSQLFMVPMNFLPPGKSADMLMTGSWAEKAFEEAAGLGQARAVGSTKSENYRRVFRFARQTTLATHAGKRQARRRQ